MFSEEHLLPPSDSFLHGTTAVSPTTPGHRPERPKLLPVENSGRSFQRRLAGHPDHDHKISQELLSVQGPADYIHENAYSAPTHERLSTMPAGNAYVEEVSMSPAAMFLSSFSPMTSTRTPDSEGETVSGYLLGSVIGHGAFSTIRRAYSSSGGTVAVKIVLRGDLARQTNPALARKRLSHEAAVWATLSHEHVLPLFSLTQTSYADFFFTLFCPAGSLFDILKRDGRPALPHDDVGMMFRQVVRGLRYLHECVGLVHRDMKLENVLVDETGACKIGDFGMARKIGELDEEDEVEGSSSDEDDEAFDLSGLQSRAARPPAGFRRHTKAGQPLHLSLIRHQTQGPRKRGSTPLGSSESTPVPSSAQLQDVCQPGSLPYAAPELLQPQSTRLRPHPAQDIWALGVMLFLMLTGRFPFNDSFEPRLQMKIMHGVFDIPSDVGVGARKVLRGCLNRSTSSRWSISMIDDVAWGVGWNETVDESIEIPSPEVPCSALDSGRADGQNNDVLYSNTMQRRSQSRHGRSQSRARTSRSKSSSARSTSRPPASLISPPLSTVSTSTVNSMGSFSPAVSSVSVYGESALLTSPPLFPDRGRRRDKPLGVSSSRSPSPSVAPKTPTDFGDRSGRLFDALAHSHPDINNASGELDVLDESEQWVQSKRSASATGRHRPRRFSEEEQLPEDADGRSSRRHASPQSSPDHGRRSDSTPPTTYRAPRHVFSRTFEEPHFLDESRPSQAIPISAGSSRSRSVDHGI